MIYVLQQSELDASRWSAWFAWDAEDLRRRFAESGAPSAELRIWSDAESAIAAFEDDAEPLWQGTGWHARLALREQLIATDALADA